MNKVAIRIWQEVDLDEITSHLLVVGDVAGDCFNCRHVGINYSTTKNCPSCNTQFKYIATRRVTGSDIENMKQINKKRPDLIFINFNDIRHAIEHAKAKNFFTK